MLPLTRTRSSELNWTHGDISTLKASRFYLQVLLVTLLMTYVCYSELNAEDVVRQKYDAYKCKVQPIITIKTEALKMYLPQ